jgi:3-hydroxyisobutyrate dehydrogenase-like beta-hydroxyacid dehydrogenase
MTPARASLIAGLLHPGEMGAAVGRCLVARGLTVLWASQDRSPATAARARAAGLTDAGTPAAVAGQADVIFSICPPHAAADLAAAVSGFSGLYVHANAISPQTAREVAGIVEAGGARYIDGGIIGPPPGEPGSTRLYLSGSAADQAGRLFDGTTLDAHILAAGPFSASAIKMAYAAWTKGSAALLLAARALADATDVSDVLLAEWALSQPGLDDRFHLAASAAAAKGWRWIAEMEQIADTMASAGLPVGFHRAAAEMFRRGQVT